MAVRGMTEQEFHRIADFLKGRYGIDMHGKKEIVAGRLENYLRSGGYGDYTSYMDAVERDVTGSLEKQLVDMLSTNHTYFMREFDHFEFMRDVALPQLRQKEARRKDLCIWCAASSTGEEPYMIAMLLRDFFGIEHFNWDTTVLATDISVAALRHAISGVYTADQVAALPEPWKRRYMRKELDGASYRVTDDIKGEVLFRQFNLMDPFPFKRNMHVVFMRNVMIYFDKETKRRLIRKVYNAMEPGGYLFIGKTESLDRESAPFSMVQPSIFRKPA